MQLALLSPPLPSSRAKATAEDSPTKVRSARAAEPSAVGNRLVEIGPSSTRQSWGLLL